MEWKECISGNIVKNVQIDHNLIKSTREIAKSKIQASEFIPDNLYIGKITLLYDALREYLECIALEKGYKVYNHECYCGFLKEIMKMPVEASRYDKLRKIRNGINYYGRNITLQESSIILHDLLELIKKFES